MNALLPRNFDLRSFSGLAQAIATVNEWGSASALVDLDNNKNYSHQDVARRIGEFGAGFAERGFRKGDSLATNLANGPDLATLILACLAYGLRLSLIEPQTPTAKLDRFIGLVEPRVLVSETGGILPDGLTAITPAELLGKGPAPRYADTSLEDEAIVIFSSGTTGAPKGIVHSHGNIIAEVDSMMRGYGCSALKRHRLVLTLAHVSGLYRGLLMPYFSAATVYIRQNFSAEFFWKDVVDHAIDFVQLVPSHIAILNRSDGPAQLPALQLVGTASAYLPPKEQQAFETRFGVPILQGYGLTECTCGITLNSLDPNIRKPGVAGLPLDVNRIRIVDSAGFEVEVGEVGELQVKGPNVARRFLGSEGPEFDGEWMKTGDMGRQAQDGNITLLGRKTNIINRGAYKIYALEVEEALRKLSDVADAAVIGVPHPLLGEDVIGFVTPGKGTEPSLLLGKLRAQLASYKIPTRLMRLDSLPRNPMGKVLREELLRICAVNRVTLSLPKGADLEIQLCRMLASLFGRDAAKVNVNLSRDDEPRWDSLGHVQVIAAVEQEFGLTLDANAAFAVRTIGELAALIEYQARPSETMTNGGDLD